MTDRQGPLAADLYRMVFHSTGLVLGVSVHCAVFTVRVHVLFFVCIWHDAVITGMVFHSTGLVLGVSVHCAVFTVCASISFTVPEA